MDPTLKVRALDPDDAPAVIALRREALSTTPLAFGASLEDDRGLSLELMRSSLADAASSAVLGAFDGEALVLALLLWLSAILRDRRPAEGPEEDVTGLRRDG